jgi:glycosyltransferase involved in cell wall biosynthesis
MTTMSLIIPVRDGERFIGETLAEVCSASSAFELIVVNDGSTDGTRSVVESFAKHDCRVRIVDNPGKGKVQALNHGFSLSKGEIVKCIDGDDLLMRSYIDTAGLLPDEAECHDMLLTDEGLRPIGGYTVNPEALAGDRTWVIENLVSLPRCSWTFGRALANHIFPMPEDLPFEDVWFSIIIKRFASAIRHRSGLCYQYRQHSGQTFGGILNHAPEKVSFRAERMLRLISVISRESARLAPGSLPFDTSFSSQRRYWELLHQPSTPTWSILSSGLPMSAKMKLLLFKRACWVIPSALRLKYYIDSARLTLIGQGSGSPI